MYIIAFLLEIMPDTIRILTLYYFNLTKTITSYCISV